MPTPLRVLIVEDIPDDAELMAGGTLLTWARRGDRITLCLITDGDKGTADPNDTREAVVARFGGPASRGLFPPENAFTPRMIPPLAAEGVEWVLVDNIHMDRACKGYPYTPDQKIPPPNPAAGGMFFISVMATPSWE